jgi:hypothetical protein
MEKPKFKHDCDKCIFLGHYDGADLYQCNDTSGIARYGNKGPQYISDFIYNAGYLSSKHLHEAFKRINMRLLREEG